MSRYLTCVNIDVIKRCLNIIFSYELEYICYSIQFESENKLEVLENPKDFFNKVCRICSSNILETRKIIGFI